MTVKRAMLAAAALIAVPVLVHAAEDGLQERKVIDRFGDCAVDIDAAGSREVVVGDLEGKDIFEKHKNLVSPKCLPDTVGRGIRLRFDNVALKAALAQALFRRELASVAAPEVAAVPPLTHREPTPVVTVDKKTGKPLSAKAIAAQEEAVARKTLDLQVSRVGECVARKNMAAARAVLLTPIGGDEEMAALRATAPVLATCIATGQQVRFDRMALRNTLAINYYRLASAALANRGG